MILIFYVQKECLHCNKNLNQHWTVKKKNVEVNLGVIRIKIKISTVYEKLILQDRFKKLNIQIKLNKTSHPHCLQSAKTKGNYSIEGYNFVEK